MIDINEVREDDPSENQHAWEMDKCYWCGKPHVKYPTSCARATAKLVKKYGKRRPNWVNQLVKEANHYLDSFRRNFIK